MAYVISDDCIACGTCIDECPVGAISLAQSLKVTNIQSIRMLVLIAVLAHLFVLLKLFTRNNRIVV